MSNLNPKTIDTVSITEVKELDEFLKIYNSASGETEAEKKEAVLSAYSGRLTERGFNSLIERTKEYTKSGQIPTETEWSQVRVVYRENGNKKIASCKDRIEKAHKLYSGTQTLEDDIYGKITTFEAVTNLKKSTKNVERIKRLKVLFGLVGGILGFVGLTFLAKVLLVNALDLGNLGLQVLSGIMAMAGVFVGSFVGYKVLQIFENQAVEKRNNAEKTETKYHDQIIAIETEIKSLEEEKNRIESQYGVEIFARTNFTQDVVREKPKKMKPEKKETKEVAPVLTEGEKVVEKEVEKQEKPEEKNDEKPLNKEEVAVKKVRKQAKTSKSTDPIEK